MTATASEYSPIKNAAANISVNSLKKSFVILQLPHLNSGRQRADKQEYTKAGDVTPEKDYLIA